jgi:SAM-dependent methyltransferase
VAEGVDPRKIVADGYDRIAERYAEWADGSTVRDEARPRYTALLLERLAAGAAVLELGCGGGGPTTRQLAERFALTGVDISRRQLELARRRVPHAAFIRADMSRLDFPPSSFDGVAAFYSLTHLPHGELPALLERIAAWLRPGGLLVASMGAGEDTGAVERDWLRVPMYFSGYCADEGQRLVERARLEIVSACAETILEDGTPATFVWVVAQKSEGLD